MPGVEYVHRFNGQPARRSPSRVAKEQPLFCFLSGPEFRQGSTLFAIILFYFIYFTLPFPPSFPLSFSPRRPSRRPHLSDLLLLIGAVLVVLLVVAVGTIAHPNRLQSPSPSLAPTASNYHGL